MAGTSGTLYVEPFCVDDLPLYAVGLSSCVVYTLKRAGVLCAVESLDSHGGLLQEVLLCGERQIWKPCCCAAGRVMAGNAGLCCRRP